MLGGREARAWTKFKSFPSLYHRIRAYNVAYYKKRDPLMYQQALTHLIEETKKGKMFDDWNDCGRLVGLLTFNYKKGQNDNKRSSRYELLLK